MKRLPWQVIVGISLILLSALFYLIHYVIFRDPHHIFIYMVGDIAFVFVEVLLVTLIIHRLLSERERRTKLEKLNMVIGAFFSEVGTELIKSFSDWDPQLEQIRKELMVTADWTGQDFLAVKTKLNSYVYGVAMERVGLESLRDFLGEKRNFQLRLLENPNLLEHESFTALLRAVLHLTEELAHRQDMRQLPDSDREHLAGDINRAYVLLVDSWLEYMRYLKDNYPYLFSLAMRINPFDQRASAVVQ